MAVLGASYPATAVALRGFDVLTCRALVQMIVVGRPPATISGISVLAIPCIGLFSSAWFLGETAHPQDIAAIAMIGAALFLVLAEEVRAKERIAAWGSRAAKPRGAGARAERRF